MSDTTSLAASTISAHAAETSALDMRPTLRQELCTKALLPFTC